MLSIPDSFLKEELRDGFYISEVMKKAWLVQLTILDLIMEIADKHGIKVFLEYGSLLGAIRHNGYIPWDDDLDISVMRADYLPLLKYLQEELPPYMDVESFYTVPNYQQPKALVSSRRKFDIGNDSQETDLTKRYHNFPCSAWVDIFPMDYIPADNERWKTIINLYSAAFSLALNMESYMQSGEFEEYLSKIERFTGSKIKRDENIRTNIWKLSDKIATMTTRKEARQCIWYSEYIQCGDRRRRPISAFSKQRWIDFEFIKAPIPEGYNIIAKSIYGDDYMTPKRGLAGHLYPYFKNQERNLLYYSKLGQLGDIY